MKSLVTWLVENDGEKTYSALFYFGDTAFFFYIFIINDENIANRMKNFNKAQKW